MKRATFSILRLVTLLALLATIFLWARTYWYDDMLTWNRPGRAVLLRSHHEKLSIQIHDAVSFSSKNWTFLSARRTPALPQYSPEFLGFEYLTTTQLQSMLPPGWKASNTLIVGFPYWAISLVLVAPIFIRWLVNNRRARRRLRAGLCPACGYDLRATPDCCPECGQPANPLLEKPLASAGGIGI